MSEPYLGEIKVISFNFPPRGWVFCNGQLLAINQNQALFSVLGTQYGGDGVTTFALPNLQSRTPIHQGQGFSVGNTGGEVGHTLTIGEMPAHNHPGRAQSVANAGAPAAAVWATNPDPMYAASANATMAAGAVSSVGGNQAHENRPPYLVLNFVIALQGIFPSRN